MQNIFIIHRDLEDQLKTKKNHQAEPLSFSINDLSQKKAKEILVLFEEKFHKLEIESFKKEILLFTTAQELSIKINQGMTFKDEWEKDLYIVLIALLWREYSPSNLCLEFFDDYIYQGYQINEDSLSKKTLSLWTKAFNIFKEFYLKHQNMTLEQLQSVLEDHFILQEWIEDYLSLLFYFQDENILKQIEQMTLFFIDHFSQENHPIVRCCRLNYVRCLKVTSLVDFDTLFAQWLNKDEKWTKGYIDWADCIYESNPELIEQVIKLLERSLQIIDIEDHLSILYRLKYYLQKAKKIEQAIDIQNQINLLRE